MPAPSRRHLGQGRRESGRAAVLQRLDEAPLDELDARLDQLLAGERVADLDRRALVRILFAQLLAREHRGAADAVAAGRRAVEDDEVAGARAFALVTRSLGRIPTHIALTRQLSRVRPVEDRLAADGRNADAVSVRADSGDCLLEVMVGRAEPQPVEERDRAGAHRDDVAQDAADAGRGSLERLDRRGMVVRLDLERDRLAFAEVDHAGVLARPLQDTLAGRRQPLQQRRRVLVAAVLGPEQREDRELEVVRLTFQKLPDPLELTVGEPERAVQRLFRNLRQAISVSPALRRYRQGVL